MFSQYPIAIIGGTGKSGQYLTTSLAHFLIEQLSSETYVRKSPFIANG